MSLQQKMLLFFVLGLLTVAGADDLNKCSQGPKEWCRNYITAKHCDQLDFCKQVVWTKFIKNDEVCELCKDAIQAVGGYIAKNQTKQKIKAVLTQLCKDVPISDLSQQCLQIIGDDFDEFYDEIVTLIANGDLVCGLLGLCQSSVSDDVVVHHMINRMPLLIKDAMKKNQLPVAAPVLIQTRRKDCSDCEAFIHNIQSAVKRNDALVKELKALVKKECDALGPGLSDLCHDETIKAINSMVYAALSKQDANAVCNSFKMCRFTSTKVTNDQCSDCKHFFADLENMIKDNTNIIDDLVKTLSNFYCLQEPSFLQPKCVRYMSMVIRTSINRIMVETPDEICQAIDFCESSVAVRVDHPPANIKNSPVCEVCQAIANELEQLLKENSTEQEIITAVEKVCTLVPKNYQVACNELVDQYAETMIKLLLNALTPHELCSSLKLCPAVAQKLNRLSGPISCVVCRLVVHELDKMIQGNRTEAAIVHALDRVCSVIPGKFSEECKKFINKYGADIVDMLINEVESGVICSRLMLCAAPSTKKQAPIGCDLCEVVAKTLHDVLGDKSTEQEIIAAVDKVCSILPSKYKTECTTFIDLYGKVIIQLLVNEISPREICTKLGLCTSNKLTLSPKKSSVKNSEVCDLCVVIITELENLITENSTEEEIIHAVEKVCSLLPAKYSGLCDIVIEGYGQKIIQALVNDVPPEKVCSTVGLCSSIKSLKKTSHALCLVCQMVITDLEVIVLDFKDETAIINALEKVCTIFPSQLKSICLQFISQNADQLIRFLFAIYPPELVCMKINVCSLSSPKLISTDSSLCPICELVATQLESMITTKSTQAEFVAALDKVCSLLPGDLTAQCNDFIAKTAPAILELLAKEVEPSKLCPELKLCPKKQLRANGEVCDICKYVIAFLDDLLESNATRDDIEKALDRLCAAVPSSLQATCDDLVKEYTPEILDLADHIFDPAYVCVHLGLCGNGKQRHLIGADHCTWGPAYWCKDQNTAAECNAMEHCKLHVWN